MSASRASRPGGLRPLEERVRIAKRQRIEEEEDNYTSSSSNDDDEAFEEKPKVDNETLPNDLGNNEESEKEDEEQEDEAEAEMRIVQDKEQIIKLQQELNKQKMKYDACYCSPISHFTGQNSF